MTDFVSEEQCTLCAGIWPSERAAFRANLETIPLREPVCNACMMAFWRNIGMPIGPDEPTQH
jgi:hypothetical protein